MIQCFQFQLRFHFFILMTFSKVMKMMMIFKTDDKAFWNDDDAAVLLEINVKKLCNNYINNNIDYIYIYI